MAFQMKQQCQQLDLFADVVAKASSTRSARAAAQPVEPAQPPASGSISDLPPDDRVELLVGQLSDGQRLWSRFKSEQVIRTIAQHWNNTTERPKVQAAFANELALRAHGHARR